MRFVLTAWVYAAGARHIRGIGIESISGVGAAARGRYHLRNWNRGEHRRLQAIRARNQPYFALKSLYLVFLLHAGIARTIFLVRPAGRTHWEVKVLYTPDTGKC